MNEFQLRAAAVALFAQQSSLSLSHVWQLERQMVLAFCSGIMMDNVWCLVESWSRAGREARSLDIELQTAISWPCQRNVPMQNAFSRWIGTGRSLLRMASSTPPSRCSWCNASSALRTGHPGAVYGRRQTTANVRKSRGANDV